MLSKQQWNVVVEPWIITAGGFCKPDLIMWNQDQAVVLDIVVTGDQPGTTKTVYHQKIAKYQTDNPEVSPWVRSLTGLDPSFSALCINWRGLLSYKSEANYQGLGLSKNDI